MSGRGGMHGNRVCPHCLEYFNVEECRLKVIRGELYTICPYCDETIKKLKNFPPEERERLLRREHDFDHDLRNLFRKDKIEDINDVYLKTNDAKDYLHNIFEGGEAEDSLDSFLFQKDPFIKKLQKIKKAEGEKAEKEQRKVRVEASKEAEAERGKKPVEMKKTKSEKGETEKGISTRGILVETKEKGWIQEISPEEAPIRVEKYTPEEVKEREITEKEVKSSDKKSVTKSQSTGDRTRSEGLREEAKKIGQWGEKYAFRCIKDEMMKNILIPL